MPEPSILVVDDDELLRGILLAKLPSAGFRAVGAENATEALALAHQGAFDLMLLDVGLPDMDGRDLCRDLREHGLTVPIIMLTAVDGEADTIRGLDAGANDYVAKPFRFGELVARIRVQLRAYEHSEEARFRIGGYLFHPAAKVLIDERRHRIRLTDREAAILRCLYRAKGLVPRKQLLQEAFGYSADAESHTIESHVYRLRQKIEPDPSQARILVSEYGGYRLACD